MVRAERSPLGRAVGPVAPDSVRSPGGPGHLLPGRGDDVLRREAELLLQLLQRRRRAEGLHADPCPVAADVALPAERRGLLDRHARRHRRRQHAVAVLLVLLARTAPTTACSPRAPRPPPRSAARRRPRTAPPRCRCRAAARRACRPARRPGRRRRGATPAAAAYFARSSVGSAWRVRTRATGSWLELHDDPPGLDHLVGVGGPDRDQAGNRAQRGQLLDRLVRGPVLADADRVVGEDVDRPASP